MSGPQLSLAISVFLACAVEAVEAFTIVLAVGSTRKWSSALLGVGVATVVLGVLIAALGPGAHRPSDRAFCAWSVGGLLLGLRPAVAAQGDPAGRGSEGAPRRDRRPSSEETRRLPDGSALSEGFDSYAFAISFKAVLLEGLEVAFIVLTFGANQGDVPLAALAAVLAVVAVIVAGVLARAPLARVPENSMKFAVGVLLTTFGVFWGAEGAGASWPGGDASLPALVALIAAVSWLMVRQLRSVGRSPVTAGAGR